MMLIGWSKDIIRPIVKCATSLFFVIFVAKFIIDFFFVQLIVEGEILMRSTEESSPRKSSSLITGGGRGEKSLFSPSFLLFNLGRTKKLSFSNTIKTSMCQRLKKKYLSLIIIAWFKMERDKIAKATCTWAQHLAELENDEFGNSPD